MNHKCHSPAGAIWRSFFIAAMVSAGGDSGVVFGDDVRPPAVRINGRRELFLDRSLIDRLEGAALVAHAPHDEGPVLSFDRPWEGLFCGYCTVIYDGSGYRLYYRGMPKVGTDLSNSEVTCLATSTDGVSWIKPHLGLYEVEGSKENNVVLANQAPCSHNFSPLLDTRPDVPADQRFKALATATAASEGLTAFCSPDGVHWQKLQEAPVISDTGWVFDSQNVAFWSDAEQKYVAYYRKAADGVRSVARVTSDDFVHWSSPELMHFSDTNSTKPSYHFYTNQTHPYFHAPHIYLSTAARFLPGRRVISEEQAKKVGVDPGYFGDVSDVVLMSSRDGTHYDCTFRGAFIKPGIGLGNWVSRTNYPALNIVPTGPAEMSLYVQADYAQPSACLHRYSMRLDGFSSVQAPLEGGELVTKPVVFQGAKLVLNFATSAAGDIRVEIQDADGKPLPGYSLADAQELIGNEVERQYSWKTTDDVSALAGKPVRLRFVLRDADLFSFQFQGADGGRPKESR